MIYHRNSVVCKYQKSNIMLINCKKCTTHGECIERRVWRYQRGNQNPYIEEKETTQWQKEKVQKDKQRSTKHT